MTPEYDFESTIQNWSEYYGIDFTAEQGRDLAAKLFDHALRINRNAKAAPNVSSVVQAFPLNRISTDNGNLTSSGPYFYLWHDGRNPILDGEFSPEQLRVIADYVEASQ